MSTEDTTKFACRNEALGIVQRTRKNLELVQLARQNDGNNYDFHLMTHVVNSLLGLVIHPIAIHPDHELWDPDLKDLENCGWPKWTQLLDERGKAGSKWTKTETLGRLVEHLRNAAAHGRFTFTDDPNSRELSRVNLVVEDAPGKKKPVNWQYEISGDKLCRFCLLLSEHIENHLG